MPIAEIRTEQALDNNIKSVLSVRTKKATSAAIASSLPGAVSNTAEARYWAEKYGLGRVSSKVPQFAHPRKAKLRASSAAIVHGLEFGPPAFSHVSPLAVVSGPRVRLYGTNPQSSLHRALQNHANGMKEMDNIDADRQVQTGGSLALAAAYRNDGRLIAVATDNGQVRVADATTRATFCTFSSPNNLPVRAVSWFRDGQKIFAAGDDAVARVWSVSEESLSSNAGKIELKGHGDAIRCAQLWIPSAKSSKSWPYKALGFTGSYDHTIRIWKLEDDIAVGEDRCLSVLSHEAPVEALLLMPSTNPHVPVWLISAGGTHIKVWNPITGACVCKTLSRHRKTITSLVAVPRTNADLNTIQMRVITAGLDALLRIHSWNSYTGQLEHLHGVSTPLPITALAFSESQNRLALGTVEGSVLIRQKAPSVNPKKRTREPKAGTMAFFTRGKNIGPSAGDYVVDTVEKKRKLQKYDVYLKKFSYGEALDEALATRNPVTITAMFEELGRRRGLVISLSNRDEESLDPVISFITRYIRRPRYTPLLIGVANKIVDIYSGVVGQSYAIDELLLKLKRQISDEVKTQKDLFQVIGEIDCLIATVAMEQEV